VLVGRGRGMVAAQEMPAAEPPSPGQAVDPGHRVLVGGGRLRREGEEVVEVVEADGFALQPRAGDAPQLQLGPGDAAGEAQPADRGRQQGVAQAGDQLAP